MDLFLVASCARPASSGRLGWLLIVIGAIIFVRCAIPAGSAYYHFWRSIGSPAALPGITMPLSTDYFEVESISRAVSRVNDRREITADLPRMAFGFGTTVLGLIVLARQRLTAHPVWHNARSSAPSELVAVWGGVEEIGLSLLRVLAAVALALVALSVVQGQPPTLSMIDQSVTRAIDLAWQCARAIGTGG
jgi:hypothetical protein